MRSRKQLTFDDSRAKSRRKALQVYAACVVITAVLLIEPIRSTPIRAGILVGLMVVWIGALALVWRNLTLRIVALLFILPPLLIALAPDRTVDAGELQAEYVHCLRRFRGVAYVWGGETHTGADCSGLIRCGLIDAEIEIGVKTFNPRLLHHAAGLWWNDCSAKALGEQFQGRTIPTVHFENLNAADYSQIRPGDIAVISNGAHVLAYLGDKTWIEANPNEKRVVTTTVPSQEVYFTMPAQIMRWRIMDH